MGRGAGEGHHVGRGAGGRPGIHVRGVTVLIVAEHVADSTSLELRGSARACNELIRFSLQCFLSSDQYACVVFCI